MARYKHYDYHQLMMVPVSLEEQLIPVDLGGQVLQCYIFLHKVFFIS
jgi:hypothetical protein